MDPILHKYRTNSFHFRLGNNLKNVCDAPDLPGVYLFFAEFKDGSDELRYIGKSGTVLQNGTFKDQLLCGRICNKQNGIKRESYLTEILLNEDLKAIRIEWFVTFDGDNKDLPGYVEGMLIQSYFNDKQRLPLWNSCF